MNILSVGELLWDLLPGGRQLGGAPANFAYHARALGVEAWVVSRVGDDTDGREMRDRLGKLGLGSELVQIGEEAATGLVSVRLNGDGEPQFTIHEPAAWDYIELSSAALDRAREARAICFGSLAQRNAVSRETVRRLVAGVAPGALRVLDLNLRQNYYSAEVILHSLTLANVVKLNEGELAVLSDFLGLGSNGLESQAEALARRFALAGVAVTCGSAGSLLFHGGNWSRRPARRVRVKDTVGAGDAFTAGLVVGLLRGGDLDQVHDLAADLAAHVCAHTGAMPPHPARRMAEDFTAIIPACCCPPRKT